MQLHLLSGKYIWLLMSAIMLIQMAEFTSCSHERNASRRKVEKERSQKDKKAEKKYHEAIKRHEKMQSDATKSMMKESKKKSPKNTPLKRSSGKKCKQ